MNRNSKSTVGSKVILGFVALLILCGGAAAQSTQVKGVINGRSGATMTVQSQNSENVTVVLTSATQVLEPEGVFRKKHLAMTALVPGLSVDVKGSFNAQNQLVADTVTFHGSDLKTAEDIQAGLTPAEQQIHSNTGSNKSKSSKTRRKSRPNNKRVPSMRRRLRRTKQRLPRRTNASANSVNTTSWEKSPFSSETTR